MRHLFLAIIPGILIAACGTSSPPSQGDDDASASASSGGGSTAGTGGGTGSGGSSGSGGGSSGSGGAPPAPGTHFDVSASQWSVPETDDAMILDNGFFAASWGGGASYWTTFDINGDGRPDLVWTAEPIFEGNSYDGRVWGNATGAPYWRVYPNSE